MRPGSTALIITPSGSGDWLPSLLEMAKRGVQAHVVLLDRPSFDGEGNTKGLRTAIQQIGFAAQIIRQGDVGVPLEQNWQQRGLDFSDEIRLDIGRGRDARRSIWRRTQTSAVLAAASE